MAHLIPCDACARHVRATDAACPFCGARVPPSAPHALPTERLSRAALFVFGAAVAGAACVPTENAPAPQPVVNTAPPIPPPHVVVVTEPAPPPVPAPPVGVVTPDPNTTAAPAYGAAPPPGPPLDLGGSAATRYGAPPRPPRAPRPGSISTRYGSPPAPDFE